MSPSTSVALIAGFFGLVTSLITFALQRRERRRAERREEAAIAREQEQRTRMARLEADLATSGRERDAQRDYEYEARKRLYTEVQPLFFQLGEAAATSFEAIEHLQGFRAFRLMAEVNNTLTINNTYRLTAPLVIVRQIQRQLTTIDLRLDPPLRAQYLLARELLHTFSRGEEIAALKPPILYTWRKDDRQHLVPATLEVVAARLTLVDGNGQTRCMTYPEFQAQFLSDKSLRDTTLPVRAWLSGATPTAKPIVWRLLVAQAYVLNSLIELITRGTERSSGAAPSGAERVFHWKTKMPIPAQHEAAAARAAAAAYLAACLRKADASPA